MARLGNGLRWRGCRALLGAAGLAAALLAGVGESQAQGRAERALQRNDADADGRVSRGEWRRPRATFDGIDTNGDGFLTLDELRVWFGEDAASRAAAQAGAFPDQETLCAIARPRSCDIQVAVRRGLSETGLTPRFPAGLDCPGIDEAYAISYSGKRDREAYHGGIDMPAPFGTPMIAAAAGEVVAVFSGEGSFRGREVVLRHSPADTGLPLWTYTLYAHFDDMPDLKPGQRVRMGQALGPTGNSGRGRYSTEQSRRRRPAIHFAAFYSTSDRFVIWRNTVVPVGGWWMDPVALYRGRLPLDTMSLAALPAAEKAVPVAVMTGDGTVTPAGAKIIWPYTCSR